MTEVLETDYLVVGAGAFGMAFTDALIDHSDADVIMVDRNDAVGGHWLHAYPFVRLHQASAFYGVASTLLGGGTIQTDGPEKGLHERATAPEICDYFDRVLQDRMLPSGRVRFLPGTEHRGDGALASRVTGTRQQVRARRAIVDARYLAPTIPATTPAPFTVGDGARVIPVNDLVRFGGASSQYVVVGSGKTATDACVWLLTNGVDPDAICWVRPRDPWMLDRARVQPDPASFIAMGADVMEAASHASSPDDLFLRLEDAEVMTRVDRSVLPSMAKAPTLAQWELELLRSISHVVRLGHVRYAGASRLGLEEGEIGLAPDAVVVHCAASGLQNPPLVPIWGDRTITLQPIRAGFPCFAAALAGFVEATVEDHAEKNRLCPPSPYSNTPADWARMQVLGSRATASFGADPTIKAWADTVALNPARTPAELRSPALDAALDRLRAHSGPGLARLVELAGMS